MTSPMPTGSHPQPHALVLKKPPSRINPPVFFGATALILILLVYAACYPEQANDQFKTLQTRILENASWFYVLTVALILLTVAFLGLSRFGDIRLGPDHARPDYKNITWFSMLFAAGMGIGLMFFGVAEPLMHYSNPPVGDPGTLKTAKEAMNLTFFHWGLHAWGIYAIVGLILAFFCYRYDLPLTLRSALYPLIGERIHGPIGHGVDIFAILGTVFGIATSLGYGVLQINSGLNHLVGLPISTGIQVSIILGVMALATLSVTTGLDKGIKILSEVNLVLALFLLVLLAALGPTVLLLKAFIQNIGAYFSEIVGKTFNLYAYQPQSGAEAWLGGWTLLYWGWWLSWSPFVGMFIARISRGRTIREFVIGVLFVPAGFTLLWMTIFGNSAIDLVMNQGMTELGEIVQKDISLALFHFLEHFPFASLLSALATLMIAVFFVTSADSGAMVIDMLASGGHHQTPLWQRLFWTGMITLTAIVLLVAGGLGALQTATIASALPFALVLLACMYGLIKALRVDIQKSSSLQTAPLPPHTTQTPWQRRLRNLAYSPNCAHVRRFIREVVKPALQMVAEELERQGTPSHIQEQANGSIRLEIDLGTDINFEYGIEVRTYSPPAFMLADTADSSSQKNYYRPEVFLKEGGKGYDVMGWSKDQIIRDIVDHYEKHLFFLQRLR